MPEEYPAIAKRTIGRWAGDRVTLVGDYAEDSDLPARFKASKIYDLCSVGPEGRGKPYRDITPDVVQVLEHELNGYFEGEGWRDWHNHARGVQATDCPVCMRKLEMSFRQRHGHGSKEPCSCHTA
jgi:hypothetical protein